MSSPDVLIVSRVFEATPQQLWDAFTDPDQIHKFFGPKGTHVLREEVTVDLRVGGEFSLKMHSDDSDEAFPTHWEFLVVDEPSKLQFKTSRDGIITIEIRDLGQQGKTLLTWTAESTTGPIEESFFTGMLIGVHSTLDNLGDLVAGIGVQS